MALLLDTNVLIALADEQHVHHREAVSIPLLSVEGLPRIL